MLAGLQMPQLSQKERFDCVLLREQGWSIPMIAKKLGRNRNSVTKWVQVHAETGAVDNAPKLRPRTKFKGAVANKTKAMKGQTGKSTRKAAKEILVKTGTKVSSEGVRKFLRAEGLKPKRPRIGPVLTQQHKKKRVEWCKRFQKKPQQWWRRVLMVDEKNFGMTWRGNRKNDVVWGDEDTVVPPRNLQRYQINCKIGLFICYHEAAPVVKLTSWKDADYAKAVKKSAVPLKKKHYPGVQHVPYFQDNDKVHKGRLSKEALRQGGLGFEEGFEFPPNSGDLMLPENCWSIMLDDMEGKDLSTKPKLLAAIKRARKALTPQILHRMFNGMPDRLAECIRLKGERIGK